MEKPGFQVANSISVNLYMLLFVAFSELVSCSSHALFSILDLEEIKYQWFVNQIHIKRISV